MLAADLALVWRASRGGLVQGRDGVLDSTLLAAWPRSSPPRPGRTLRPPRAASSATRPTSCSIKRSASRPAFCSRPPSATTHRLPTPGPSARFFAAAKRYFQLDTSSALDEEAALLRVTRTFCAILVVALAAHQTGAPDLRLSPARGRALPAQRSHAMIYAAVSLLS